MGTLVITRIFLFEFSQAMYCNCTYRMGLSMRRSGFITPQRISIGNSDK